jgi:hypothetical protein
MLEEQRVPRDPGEVPTFPIGTEAHRFGWTKMTVQQGITEANLLNLLIVDDERVVREGCRDIALALGSSTFTAETADQAYRILDRRAWT